MSSAQSRTPVEDAMRAKVCSRAMYKRVSMLNVQQITHALNPSNLEIYNDSSMHAHHRAMKDTVSKETHFRLVITSEAFRTKMQPARHRMVYALLKEELERPGGIHALQLRTRTPEEEAKLIVQEQADKGEHVTDVEQK